MLRHLVLMAALASPAAAQEMTAADCDALVDKVQGALSSMSVTFGDVAAEGGQCVVQQVASTSGRPGGPEWRADRVAVQGAGPGGTFAETGLLTSLALDIRGLNIAPDFPDPVPAHLVGVQPYLRGIDATVGLNWDSAERSLSISRLLVDFAGNDKLDLTARVTNVDASNLSGAMIGLASFLVTDADIKITSRGLLTAVVTAAMGPKLAADDAARDEALRAIQAEATTLISRLPGTTFSLGSKSALRSLMGDLPDPVGTLRIKLQSDAGIGPVNVMRYALNGAPATLADIAPLFDGLRVDIAWPGAFGQ
jgi:hypothetical protein